MSIAERRSIFTANEAPFRVDLDHSAATLERDVPRRPKVLGTEKDAFEGFGSGEIVLGQGRTLVGQFCLVAEETDRTLELLLTQRPRRLRSPVAGTDDEACLLYTSDAADE